MCSFISNTKAKFFIIVVGVIFTILLLIWGTIKQRSSSPCFIQSLLPRSKKVPHHLEFTPLRNSIRNAFSKRDECMICFSIEKTARMSCSHRVCFDCLREYIRTALGDSSMFPIKCPGYNRCRTLIDPNQIQRVLNRKEFCRFNLFNDRALFGDGMLCIFCSHYVVFPSGFNLVRVQCPHCRSPFCMRCGKPWHYGKDCISGNDNFELEEWRKKTGAQKCPGCEKIIEKEDPETCNHVS